MTAPIHTVSLDFLRAHALFAGIGDEDLFHLLRQMRQQDFQANALLVSEGEWGDGLFLLMQGCVEVLKTVPTNAGFRLERIATLEAGETMGEMQLLDLQPRSATVRALDYTIALCLPQAAFEQLAKERPALHARMILNLARQLCRRLRQIDARFAISLFSLLAKEAADPT